MENDPYAMHEVVHTSSVLEDVWETHIVQHPVVQGIPELKELAEKIDEAMCDFYQVVGSMGYAKSKEETA